ncbi:MAG TPA: hypothetical protein DDW76_14840 [Cyanobacteria bacterium UBA11369]|nr:hypothetical protein [Cyanobacteria bacterium UBA11371]HBE16313.1 hypothetical protein [Cyanobacteria bacterium UBA11367]HBE36102.1 hypothetical protein [Cyanobacteria bacterium UBA11368]HBE50034.1 hypothetical protein [Cyanobacteria bacterium UBA11369]
MKWLTPEDAVVATNFSVTIEELIKYTLQSEDEEKIEERFQKIGLLFDRDRWQAQKPYLALLSPATVKKQAATESSASPSDSDSIDDEDFAESDEENALSETEESSNLQSEQQEEPYIFEKCTVELHLTFKPDDGHPDGRIVIISASSHGDFPVSERIRESSLRELPPPLKELLEQLVADFPNRQVRRQIANARNQKKRTANPNKPKSEASSATASAAFTESKTTGTQLTLFGI